MPTIWPSLKSCWIIQKSEKCIFEWSKLPKMSFFAIFSSLLYRTDLILHILIEVNCVHHSAIVWLMLNHAKMHFWMIQIAKNNVFGHFLDFLPNHFLSFGRFDSSKRSVWGLSSLTEVERSAQARYSSQLQLKLSSPGKNSVWKFRLGPSTSIHIFPAQGFSRNLARS